MQPSEATRLHEIEGENAKLKKIRAAARLHIEALKVGFEASLRVTYLTAPPMVLRPYSVPCGPRSTSMRSRS